MRALARSIVMLFAYALAISAETAVFLSVIYFAASDLLVAAELLSTASPRSDTFHPFVITLVWILWAVFTLLPVLIAFAFAEMCGSQSVRYFLIWGLIAAAGAWFVFVIAPLFDNPRSISMLLRDAGAFSAAGLAFGFVYWIIAGRTSGDWIVAQDTHEKRV